MSFVVALPEIMTSAATDLASIGTNVDAAHAAAATSTTRVSAAAGDEVSAAIAAVFSGHAQAYQGLAEKAAAFQDQFVATLKSGAGSYAGAEAAAAASLQPLTASAATLPFTDVLNQLAYLAAHPWLTPAYLWLLGWLAFFVTAVLVSRLLASLPPWVGEFLLGV